MQSIRNKEHLKTANRLLTYRSSVYISHNAERLSRTYWEESWAQTNS